MAEKISVLMLGGSGTLSKTIACKACRLGFAVSVLNRGNNNTSIIAFLISALNSSVFLQLDI